jgi:DNA-binding response OmpR family regulator
VSHDILVVEDEPDIRSLVVLHLDRQGYRCRTAATGPEALRVIATRLPDLVILDLMLPDLDGLEVCRRLRGDSRSAMVPIIMLTAKAEEVDRIVGLEVGADDYVVKPFSPKELVARVRAVLRRAGRPDTGRRLAVGALVLDPARRAVTLHGTPLTLTPKELDLLQSLLEASGRVLSREYLLNHVWGYARAEAIESRTVDAHIHRLRVKLGDEAHRLVTVKSAGYRLEPD